MRLINCEVSLTLTWSENCALTDITTQTVKAPQGDNPARPAIYAPLSATFKIADTKLYVPVVTLSAKYDNNFLEQLKSGFKRTTDQKENRLFVLSFENEEDRTSFSKYYVPKGEIKDFNVLIDGSFFDVPVKKIKKKHTKKL